MPPRHARIPACLLVGASCLLAGCIAGGSGKVKVKGNYISHKTLSVLTEHVTTEAEALELLGEPTRKARTDTGVIYAFESKRTSESSGRVLLLFSGKDYEEEVSTAYILCEDGVVTKAWMDRRSG